jgi:hypothetical protein
MTDDQLDKRRLGAFAGRAANRIASALPEYAALITADDEGNLAMEIPCPSPSVDRGVFVLTDNDDQADVSVGFHTHHWHFRDWHEAGTDAFLEDAIGTIRALLAEGLVVVSVYRDRELVASWFAESEDAVTGLRATVTKELGRKAQLMRRLRLSPSVSATVRSWRGAHDVDLEGFR